LDTLQRARVDLQRAQIAFTLNRGREAPPLLLRVARQLEQLDPRLAGETYLDALLAAMFAGALTSGVNVREAAQIVRAASPRSRPPRPSDLLLDGLAVRFNDGFAPAVPLLRKALAAFCDQDLSVQEELRWLWHACITAAHLWDDGNWELLATRFVRTARETGALTMLPLALSQRIGVHVLLGQLTEAAALREELDSVTEATGDPPPPIAIVLLAAWQGREAEAVEAMKTTITEVLRRGEGDGLVKAQWAAALLYNSLGRYEEALSAAQEASNQPPVLGVAPWAALSELVEAATRSAVPERGAPALDQLADVARATGGPWVLGVEARCRALLSRGRAASVPTARPLPGLGARASGASSPAPTSCTANGSVARSVASTRDSSCAPPTRCSSPSAPKHSLNGPPGSCERPARPPANASRRPAWSSPPRRPRSRVWFGRDFPTLRSGPGCSSARGPSSGT